MNLEQIQHQPHLTKRNRALYVAEALVTARAVALTRLMVKSMTVVDFQPMDAMRSAIFASCSGASATLGTAKWPQSTCPSFIIKTQSLFDSSTGQYGLTQQYK